MCAQTLGLTGSDEGRVQGFYPIGRHDDFNISPRVKAIKLVEQLQHGPLDLPLPTGVGVIPAGYRHIYLKNLKKNTLHDYTRQHTTKALCKIVHQKAFASLMEIPLVGETQQPACCREKTINKSSILKLLTLRHLSHF